MHLYYSILLVRNWEANTVYGYVGVTVWRQL